MNHAAIEAFAEAFASSPRLAELEIRSADTGTLRLRRSRQAAPKPRPPVLPSPATKTVSGSGEPRYIPTGTVVESSLVGIYRASAKAKIGVGSTVLVGQPLGAVEVMRLLSEVPAPVAGEIVTMFVQDGEPVEYGQPLFEIAPSSGGEKETENA